MAITELHPQLDKETEEGRETRKLWRRCEELLSEHSSGWSLDRLIALRDYYWFDTKTKPYFSDKPIPLHQYLSGIVSKYLINRPGITEVNKNENFFDALAHYRWLAFALPEDLLLMSSLKVYPPPTYVDIDPPLFIRCILDNGVSEIHQHIGASMDFKTYWMSALAALASPNLDPDSIKDPGVPFKDSETFFKWLLAAAITRSVLMEYLLSGVASKTFIEFVLQLRQIKGQYWQTLEKTLQALRYGNKDVLPNFFALRNLYQKIHPQGYQLRNKPPTKLEDAWKLCDPIAVRLSLKFPNEGEVRFVRKSLAFIERGKPERDTMFEGLFWQVIRIRNILYRTIVQRPMTAGLQWFVRFNNRLWPLLITFEKIRTEVSFDVACGSSVGSIAALEIRCPAKNTSKELAEVLCNLTESWKNVLNRHDETKPEFGIVLLFPKARDQEHRWESGNPPACSSGSYSEPLPRIGSTFNLGVRYANFFQSQVKMVRAAANLINRKPLILWVLRGIDVASDELSIPTWVLVPLFLYLERESAFAAASVQDPLIRPKPLRITAHVGEDFRHLMEGMRRIFETVNYLLRRSGGRLGHATALGYDPRQWAEQAGTVMKPMEERLWDLVFEWRLYTRFETPYELRIAVPSGRVDYLENQIRKLSKSLFDEQYEPHVMAHVHHKLHTLWSGPEVNENQTEVCLHNFSQSLKTLDPQFYCKYNIECKVIEAYRKSEKVFHRGQQIVSVVVDESEIIALHAVQDALRNLVSVREIVTEVNPSSNLLIGNLLDLRNHPTLRLFPPEPQEGGPPPVRIAIGSDDPITFSTHLLREYTLLYSAALSAGYSENSVKKWLEEIQCTGMDARFTLPWPRIKGKDMVDFLLEEFDDYLQRPKYYRRYLK